MLGRPMAACISSKLSTTTIFPPAAWIAWSYSPRCDFWMTTSLGIPVVSGNRFMMLLSVPAIHAATTCVMAAHAPLLTMANSAPISCASRAPTASCSSSKSTKLSAAAIIAALTSGSMSDPPRTV